MTDSPTPTEATDLISRLETLGANLGRGDLIGGATETGVGYWRTVLDAIELLRSQEAELNRLNAALQTIAQPEYGIGFNRLRGLARAALAGNQAPIHSGTVRGAHGCNERNARRRDKALEARALSAETALREAREAAFWLPTLMATIEAFEADDGMPMDDDHVLGRVSDSRGMPSFNIRVGHFRRLALALTLKQGGQDQGEARARPSAGLDREAVARIIDPVKWGVHDHYINVAEPYEFLDRADPLGIQFRATANEAVAESLAKADAILALAPTDRVAELEGALRPFAVYGAEMCAFNPDHPIMVFAGEDQWGRRLRVADFRRAAALLPSEERGSGK